MEYPTERESNIDLKRRNFNWSLAGWGQQNRNIPTSKICELERHLRSEPPTLTSPNVFDTTLGPEKDLCCSVASRTLTGRSLVVP